MRKYDATAATTAPPAVVWRLLADARTWPTWSAVDELVLDRSSGLDPDGHDPVGAVRAFRTGKTVTGERVTGLVEEKQLTYEDAFNSTIHDYRAVVDLTPTPDGGTLIHWHGTYSARTGLGWLMQGVMRRVMQRMADGLATHAAEITPR
ncbi:SRPBCC family protein [Amycolatopsis sp. 195334CR]|uniref:SRPBCC family protein n=1 Tax=Amycolatopsis sp. 195334CR TaxID=2814588 RepID=UPI001A8C7B37|nr:SRPBCC family protein [Amycolatopsis sp. 195334CR]MBN6038218.1 SRPBCC family protein [Amycolatopsis sp. 195334CR]